jgi:hypothetical protein
MIRPDRQLREPLARQRYALPLNDSIYRDLNYLEGFSLNLKELSDVVNPDGHLVGLDKSHACRPGLAVLRDDRV